MSPDLINALFEVGGFLVICLSAYKCYENKSADGIHWALTSFFFIWGIWNLYFYPAVGQMLSFYAGCLIVLANMVYTALIIKYSRRKT